MYAPYEKSLLLNLSSQSILDNSYSCFYVHYNDMHYGEVQNVVNLDFTLLQERPLSSYLMNQH